MASSSYVSAPPPPPPAYTPHSSHDLITGRWTKPTLLTLPDSLLLLIISGLPISSIAFDLRPTSVQLCRFSSSVLRSVYHPLYTSLVKAPYTSSPSPLTREERVLDLFALGRAYREGETSASELLLTSGQAGGSEEEGPLEKDVFGLLQPQTRTEDLVIALANECGIISGSKGEEEEEGWLHAEDLKIVLGRKEAKVVLPFRPTSLESRRVVDKVVSEVPRKEGELLERLAKRIVRSWAELRLRKHVEKGWYEWV